MTNEQKVFDRCFDNYRYAEKKILTFTYTRLIIVLYCHIRSNLFFGADEEFFMEDLRKLDWAKQCIECLANGIQPFTGEVLENSILDDPQLIRCFFFVRDVLNEKIASVGQKKPKETFVLSDALLARIPIQPDKICLTKFLSAIKEINDDKAPKFKDISEYLINEGLLEVVTNADNKAVKRATEKALPLGIENQTRMNSRGQSYTVVVYTAEGQQYLIECLKKIYQ